MYRFIALCVMLFFFCMFLGSCTTTNSTIQTNQYYQTDYQYFCFDGDKTWSQIVICLDAESKAEKAQNKITNDLLSEK